MIKTLTTIIPAESGFYWIELNLIDDGQYEIIKKPIVAFHVDTNDNRSVAMPVVIYHEVKAPQNIRVGAMLHPDGTLIDKYGSFYPDLDCYCRQSVAVMEKRRLAESEMKFGGTNGSIKH